MLNRMGEIILESTMDVFHEVAYFFAFNMRNFANILSILCPYLMYFIGQYIQIDNYKFIYGPYLIIPIAIILTTYYLRSAANKTGKGNTCPIPAKRFTDVSEDGEVSIEHDRLQELLLYVADLEDWMERKNML